MRGAAVLKYPGAKFSIAEWIIGHMPTHRTYCEPYFGSGAVFFTKQPSRLETINDLDGRVVNLWRVIRERPDELARAVALTPWSRQELSEVLADVEHGDDVERARRFLVWCWQQIGRRTNSPGSGGSWRWTKDAKSNPVGSWLDLPNRIGVAAARLQPVLIECRPALDVVEGHNRPDVLIYADPPYTPDTVARLPYKHVMTLDEHDALLGALEAHSGPVLLSGFRSTLYDERLTHWRRIERGYVAENGAKKTECLWLNPVAIGRMPQAALPLEGAA
jgi:DNA adenine methylase